MTPIRSASLFFISRTIVTGPGIPVFLLPVSANRQQIDLSLIPSDQQEAISRYRVPNDRDKRLIARSFVYQLLREHYGITRFDTEPGPYKKPLLAVAPHIDFSISYSGDFILAGINTRGRLGLDIECINRQTPVADMAASIMCAEELSCFSKLPEGSDAQYHFFFSLFSAKEAIIKAFGTGLYYDVLQINTRAGGLYKYEGSSYHHIPLFEDLQDCCINLCWQL